MHVLRTYIQLNMSVCGFRLMKPGGELANEKEGGEELKPRDALYVSLLPFLC